MNLVCRYWRQAAIGAKELELWAYIAMIAVPDSEPEKHGEGAQAKRENRAQFVGLERERSGMAVSDFEMMRVLGKGCASKVLLARHKVTSNLFALKVTARKRVSAEQEVQYTSTEQAVLRRMVAEGNPFVVMLRRSFHDRDHLFLVTDFHPGGELATQISRWGRLGRNRARFYAAEIVEGIEGLHKNGVIHRDLKPENVLIGSDGHVVLAGFGLSKEFPCQSNPATVPPNGIPGAEMETTSTFRGTAEYIAPEVIQGFPYNFEIDWWSFGTMLYEMLAGIVWTLDF